MVMCMVRKSLTANLSRWEWEILAVYHAIADVESWNEFLRLFVSEPEKLVSKYKEGAKQLEKIIEEMEDKKCPEAEKKVRINVSVNLSKDEWEMLMLYRALMGVKSWSEFLRLFVLDPEEVTNRLKGGIERFAKHRKEVEERGAEYEQ